MGQRYDKVQNFETGLHDWLRGLFLKERLLFADMMELMLEAVEARANVRVGDQTVELLEEEDLQRSADLLITARLFNDFESAKLLLLYGLPDQSYRPMRDVVECMMMVRLIYHDKERARRWLTQLKEYQPADVRKRLDELGVETPEYELYGFLSAISHVNLLGSLGTVAEVKVGEKGVFRQYHFGGFRNESWIARQFKILLSLQYMALYTVITQAYGDTIPDLGDWVTRLAQLLPRLKELGLPLELEDNPDESRSHSDKRVQDFVRKKLKVRLEAYSPQSLGGEIPLDPKR